MGETGADNGTDARIDLQHVAAVRTIAARAARRAMRRSLVIAALANAAIVVGSGVGATWLPGGWPTWLFFFVVTYLTFRTADRVEKSGLVRAKPASRVLLVTAVVTIALAFAQALYVNPASAGSFWPYVTGAAVVLAVGLVGAWWVGR